MMYVPQTGVKKAAPNKQTLVKAIRKPLSCTKYRSPTTSFTSDSKGASAIPWKILAQMRLL